MHIESIKGIKYFFKETTENDDFVNGLACQVDGEYISPCSYVKPWLQEHGIKELYNQFYLINDGDSYDVVLFLPLHILKNLSEEMYSEIIKKFELKLKKAKEQLKIEDLQKDF